MTERTPDRVRGVELGQEWQDLDRREYPHRLATVVRIDGDYVWLETAYRQTRVRVDRLQKRWRLVDA